MRLLILSIMLLNLTTQNQAYDILMLVPLASWSEYQLAKALAEMLTGADHQVTLISGFEPTKDSLVTEIFVGTSNLEYQNLFELDMLKIISFLSEQQEDMCYKMYTNNDVLKIWKNRHDFDAIIAASIVNEIISPFLIDYNGAYIGVSALGIEGIQINNQGHRLPRSVTPFILANFDENMNFFERVLNLVIDGIVVHAYEYDMVPQVQSLLEKYFPGMPSAIDLYRNYSLLLLNSHFVTDGTYPLLPNQVEIGTLTARLPQPLDKDLGEFIDGAENGVIYFSLGTVAKGAHIPIRQMAMLLEAFRHLPQRVVWKFEGDQIKNLPSNVITRKWFSQQDILGHPSTLVFISHCGNFGIQEAKYHGVPVLGVPISFDQHRNAARLARKSYGLVLNWDDMTVESIIENINILIKDTSYRERLQAVSKALRDQKENPKDRALWWIEYAIRHKDAPHMHYAGKDLNAIQYHMIDVWSFLISILVLWVILSYYCLRRCSRQVFGSKSKQE